MKERPILFSGLMVRAILDGRKTQTRRIAKIPADTAAALEDSGDGWSWEFGAEGYGGASRSHNGGHFAVPMRCPYGAPGDRLWVRETWCLAHPDYHDTDKEAGTRPVKDGRFCFYAATDDVDTGDGSPWKPSIHMPRWASRVTLEVTAVRVERLQAISEADAVAEGIQARCDHGCSSLCGCASCIEDGCQTAASRFADLWDAINGDRAPWASNPWVWVVEFKRIGGAS